MLLLLTLSLKRPDENSMPSFILGLILQILMHESNVWSYKTIAIWLTLQDVEENRNIVWLSDTVTRREVGANKIDTDRSPTEGCLYDNSAWWRHQMETFSAWLAICAGNSPAPGEFPTQRPVTRSFDVFFDLRLNERLNDGVSNHQPHYWWGWWFETPSRPLWRHCNGGKHKILLPCNTYICKIWKQK